MASLPQTSETTLKVAAEAPITASLLENINDAVAVVDKECRYVYVNARTAELARMSKEQMLGRSMWELFPEAVNSPGFLQLHRAMGERIHARFDEHYAPYDLWLEIDAYPVEQGLLLLVRDVTDRKSAEQRLKSSEQETRDRLRELELLYQTAPVGLGFVDTDLRFRRINQRLAAMNGLPLEQHLGRSIAELIPEATASIETALREALRTGRAVLGREIQAATKAHDGQPRCYRISYHPVREGGNIYGLSVVVEDITAEKIADTDLRESERRYRTLFETTGDGILIVNDTGRYVDVNESYARILKTTKEQLVGAHFSEFIPPDRLKEAEAKFTALQAGSMKPIDFPLRATDGTIVDLSWTSSAYYLPGLYFCVCRDLSDRKRAEIDRAALLAAEQEARETAEQFNRVGPILLAELDLEKLVQSVTDIATRLAGAEFGAFFHNVINERGESYALYSLSGVPREMFAGFPMPRKTEVFAPTFRGDGVVRSDDITKDPRYGKHPPHFGKPKGHLPVCSYLAVPVVSRSGEVLGGLFFGHSSPGKFTERHEALVAGIAAQAAIAMDNARLFEQAQWAQNELKRSNEDLRRANRDLEAFAYSASHDLQEPLRNVSIFSQLLVRRLGAQAEGEPAELLRGILKGVARMQNLVQDLLSYSAATKPAEGPAPLVDSAAVLASVQQVLQNKIEESGARITAGNLPTLRIHEVHLAQVFQNLLSNALKYRRDESPEVRVSAVQQDGWWTFSVADNGIGIEPRYRAQIFGLFKRLHSRDQYAGSGVGLSICQRIVEQYGGRIWAESVEQGNGSIFRFTIPVHDAEVKSA